MIRAAITRLAVILPVLALPMFALPMAALADPTLPPMTEPVAISADHRPLAELLTPLAADAGIVLEMSPAAAALPVTLRFSGSRAEALERLLRPTSHVVTSDQGRPVRISVFGLAEALPEQMAESPPGGQAADQAADQSGDPFQEERRLISQGLAPDTGRPTGLARALNTAAQRAEAERTLLRQQLQGPPPER
jgi:hypothetical protein